MSWRNSCGVAESKTSPSRLKSKKIKITVFSSNLSNTEYRTISKLSVTLLGERRLVAKLGDKLGRWVAKLGGWVAKLGRWATKVGIWLAKLVARLLATAALRVRIQTYNKNTKMGDMSQGVANTL